MAYFFSDINFYNKNNNNNGNNKLDTILYFVRLGFVTD